VRLPLGIARAARTCLVVMPSEAERHSNVSGSGRRHVAKMRSRTRFWLEVGRQRIFNGRGAAGRRRRGRSCAATEVQEGAFNGRGVGKDGGDVGRGLT
jgi:hypothetical protein